MAQPRQLRELSPQAAVQLIEAGAVLLDVREDEEWQAGHAPQAIHIAMSRFTRTEADKLPTDRPVICVCHLGGRSASVGAALAAQGWDAYNFVGGMHAWQVSGLPVIDEHGAPGEAR